VHTDTLTAKHLQQAPPVKRDVRQPRGHGPIVDYQHIDSAVPVRTLRKLPSARAIARSRLPLE
jgi:hypothetical protein